MEDRGGRNEGGLQRAQSEVRDAAVISVHRESQSGNISDQISPQYAMVLKSSNGSGSGEDRNHPSEGDTWSGTGRGDSETIFVYPENDDEYGEGDSGIMVRDKNQSPPYDATTHHTVTAVVTISNNGAVESGQSNENGDGHVALASYVSSDVIGESSYKSATREPKTVSTHGSTTSGVEGSTTSGVVGRTTSGVVGSTTSGLVVPWSTPSERVYESSMEPIPPPMRSFQTRNGPGLDDSIQVEIDTVSHPMSKRQPRFNTEVSTLQNFYDDGFLDAMKWRTKKRFARRRKKYLAAIITILFVVLLLIGVVVGLLLYSNGTFGHFPMGTNAREIGGNIT